MNEALGSLLKRGQEGLAEGRTIPSSMYTRTDVYELERDVLFRNAWTYVCPAEWLTKTGDQVPVMVTDVPVVLTMGRDGVVRGFVNVCLHRGQVITQERTCARTMVCPYHSWAYSLDGRLVGAPRASSEMTDPTDGLQLKEVSVHVWGPWVFVNLAPEAEPPLAEFERLDTLFMEGGLDIRTLKFDSANDRPLHGNWKLALENFVECYHCLTVHRDLNRFVDLNPGPSKQEVNGKLLLIWSPIRPDALDRDDLPYPMDGPVTRNDAHLMMPNTTMSVLPGKGNIWIGSWFPESPTLTRRVSHTYFSDDCDRDTRDGMIAYLTEVGDEDAPIVDYGQIGWGSGAVDTGYLLRPSEDLVHALQSYVVDSLVEHLDGN